MTHRPHQWQHHGDYRECEQCLLPDYPETENGDDYAEYTPDQPEYYECPGERDETGTVVLVPQKPPAV